MSSFWSSCIGFLKIISYKMWIAIVAAIAIGTWLFTTIHSYQTQIAELKVDNDQLTAQVTQLKDDVKNCVNANESNLDTITHLRNDKENAKDAVKQMEKQREQDKKNNKAILDAIKKAPESENGTVSPILKNTIKSIIENRKNKENML